MKKAIYLLLAVTAVVLSAGCASGENSIISMNLDGAVLVVDSLVIDAAACTVTAVIEPVDISKITPVFELSGNAEIGDITLKDGEACTCIVTAEDGTASEWSVTVTVQPGVTYTSKGVTKTFIKGVIHSTDANTNEDYGNGVPYLSACTTGQSDCDYGYGFKEVKDLASEESYASELAMVGINNTGSSSIDGFAYSDSSDPEELYYLTGYINADTTTYGEVGEWITGTFSGTVDGYADGGVIIEASIAITDGFFKFLRMEDDLHSP